ncbi:uncharacterized protein LOC107605000 [Arachis ipaensis]|uniref:uncharacterized protein LOC107605000 n=1 Tax=Arachis ipaensis TaxID=130454 RepID=UPI0007AF52F9|nr:uncharacterized protein LOC107605000 [Arachis ipaensis]XP_025628042.1 uncharacterized protein LOC112721181 [Arachis hypogaea]
MTRFTKVAMSIPDLHPEVHLHTIKSGLRPGKFQEAIAVAKPKTLAKFYEKAKGQIDIEEPRQARKIEKSWYKEEDKPRDSKKSFKQFPRYESYTQFKIKCEDIIKEILNSKLIKPPQKVGNYPYSKGVDKSKYCTFHQKHGHTTDECVIAKDLLERLAWQGHLDKYIGSHIQHRSPSSGDHTSVGQHNRDKERASTSHPEQPRGIINYIFGGFAGGGTTSLARKCSYRAMLSIEASPNNPQTLSRFPQMMFQSSDFDTTTTNLDDPIVISIQLGDLLVKQILLDPGSSANVLFYSTFQKMKLSNNILQPSTGDLVRFSGATYQRLMDKVFAAQIGRNLKVYVDDMVSKTKLGNNHLDDLTEIFNQIRKYNMQLNLEKCAYGVQGGKFLGFMLTNRGIEANPEKC